jgi:glutamyl-tRNA synthetase
MKEVDTAELVRRLGFFHERLGISPQATPALAEVIAPLRGRSKTLVEMAEQTRLFYRDLDGYEPSAAAKHLTAEARGPLAMLHGRLAALPGWTAEAIHGEITATAADCGLKLGQIAQPLRVALSGTTVSPPIDHTAALLGRERCLARIERALAHIEGLPSIVEV